MVAIYFLFICLIVIHVTGDWQCVQYKLVLFLIRWVRVIYKNKHSPLNQSLIKQVIWDKVFKNGQSKICGRQPLKNFTYIILEYFLPYMIMIDQCLFSGCSMVILSCTLHYYLIYCSEAVYLSWNIEWLKILSRHYFYLDYQSIWNEESSIRQSLD